MTLYLVPTPIGNLADITFRAVEILKSVDYILCEDTRHARKLLKHYSIQTPLKSFHKFNEAKSEEFLIQELLDQKSIALISDAGTPLIADPGWRLIRRCRDEQICVTPLPGPCAAITALIGSGFSCEAFCFYGFLPRKKQALRTAISTFIENQETVLCYESPHRLLSTLKIFAEIAPDRCLSVARELTKLHEEFIQGTASELVEYYQTHPLKGEIVLLVEGGSAAQLPIDLELLVVEVQKLSSQEKISMNEATKRVATKYKISKRELYAHVQSQKNSHQ